jgi:hypothetical protein
MSGAPAPIVVSALLGAADFAWADALRRAHYPPERNRLPAHLTLSHHLPPSFGSELARRLAEATRAPPPAARIDRLLRLGTGVALGVDSPALAAIRQDLAEAFDRLLTPQDRGGWRPHVTIQNKVTPAAAKALHQALSGAFRPRALAIAGLASFFYRDGAWEAIDAYRFRGVSRSGR